MLERVGVAAASVLHVGDSLVNDVQGAQAAGMRAAWINRGGHHLPNSVHPDLVLRRLTDLPAILTGC